MMLRSITFCLLVAFQVATSEPPPHCRRAPPEVEKPLECCEFPVVFEDEDLKACGIDKSKMYKPGPPDCTKDICLLKRFDLMKDDTNVDLDAVAAHLDSWAESNPDFKDVIEQAKEKCLKDNLFETSKVCEPTKIIFCSLFTIFMDCPKWKDSDNCGKLKDHIEECKPFFSS